MADPLRPKDIQSTDHTSPGDRTTASACCSGMLTCDTGNKGLAGLPLLAVCYGAPVLLLLTLPVLGSALGSLGLSVVSTLAVLACPMGMAVMIWLMRRAQQAGARPPAQTQPARGGLYADPREPTV